MKLCMSYDKNFGTKQMFPLLTMTLKCEDWVIGGTRNLTNRYCIKLWMLPLSIKIVSFLLLIVRFKLNISNEEFINKVCKLMWEFASVMSSTVENLTVGHEGSWAMCIPRVGDEGIAAFSREGNSSSWWTRRKTLFLHLCSCMNFSSQV